MAHDPLEGPLRELAQLGALALGATALALLGLALAGELLRGHRRAPAFLAALERRLPGIARTTAVTLLASLTISARPAAAADDGVRSWLRHGDATTSTTTTTTTTSTTAPRATVATPDSLQRREVPSPAAPVVLAPRLAAPVPPAPPPDTPPPDTPPPDIPPPADVYRVAPGDCLWSIAARRLGPGATNRAIDRAWRAIYAANRAEVGADPGLVHPGLVLSLPPLEP